MDNKITLLGIWIAVLLISAVLHASTSPPHRLDIKGIEQVMGRAGEFQDGVHRISLPRTDLPVAIKGVKLKPDLAQRGWIAFEEVGDQGVMVGELVLTEDETVPVLRMLRAQGIEVNTLHNRSIGERPRIIYAHVAGKGQAVSLASHLKDALDLTATP